MLGLRLCALVALCMGAPAVSAQGVYIYSGFGLGLGYGQATIEGGAGAPAEVDVLTASLQSAGRRGQAALYVSRASGNRTLTAFGATFGVYLARQRRGGGTSEGMTAVLSGSISQSIEGNTTVQAASVDLGFAHAVRVGAAMEIVPAARVGNVFALQEESDADEVFVSGALGLLLRGSEFQIVLEPSVTSGERAHTIGVSLRLLRGQ